MTKTKIVIAGIGGVGGYFGGLLANHFYTNKNVEICFFARGGHLSEIKNNGLKVINGDCEFIAKPTLATDNPAEIGIADFIIVATKSYDLETIVQQLRPCINQDTIILPLLNGVDSKERIKHILTDNIVLDGCVYIVSRLKQVGVIENSGNIQKLYFGLNNFVNDQLSLLERLLKEANIDASLSENISTVIWEKFIFISPIATATSYFDTCIGELMADEEKLTTCIELIEEVKQIAKSKQIVISDDITEKTLAKLKALPFETTSSMHSDFIANKPTNELESLTGYVIREGRKYNLETPIYLKTYAELKEKVAYNTNFDNMTKNNIKFINPDGSNKEEVKSTFITSTNLLIDYLSSANKNYVLPKKPNWDSINLELPQNPIDKTEMETELQTIMNLCMNPANNSYIGHMDSLPTAYSIIGSLYSSALNNNMFSLEMSPYFTRIEYAIIKQFSNLFGLPESSAGIIGSGGTLSNIQAIITARNYFLKSNTGDISISKKPLVFFASEHSHVSIKKAAMISGLGIDSLIYVKSDVNGKMDVSDLRLKVTNAIKNGQAPFAVVATLGTTVTGNIDPIQEIAVICKLNNLWLHADAIYGGAIILSNKEKHRLKGIEKADSIAFNPQKWMHIAKTCSLLLFRDSEILNRYFSMKAYYTKEQNEFVNLSEISIQGTKQADVLKLWLSILSIGMSGYEEMIDKSYSITQNFVEELKQLPNIEFASEQEMNIPTFRLIGKNDEESDNLNALFNEYAIREHNLFFSLPKYNNKLWQRTILLNPFIDNRIIRKVSSAIKLFKK